MNFKRRARARERVQKGEWLVHQYKNKTRLISNKKPNQEVEDLANLSDQPEKKHQ